MTVIRFENTEDKFKTDAEKFLKSLGLDPKRWLEDQTTELREGMLAEVFGIEVPLSRRLVDLQSWVCRVAGNSSQRRFLVADWVWVRNGLSEKGKAVTGDCEGLWLNCKPGQGRPLTDLCLLAGLPALTSLEIYMGEALTDLKELAGLPRLSRLRLHGCDSLTDLKPLAGLTQLTSLELCQCASLTDLEPLAGLTQLTSLEMNFCGAVTNLKPLAGLSQLTRLDVSSCGSLTDLEPLSRMPQLTSLDVSGCDSLTDLKPLASLRQLTSLDVSGYDSLTNLEPLAGLTQLTSLNLFWSNSLTDLKPLAGLTQLTSLNLRGCGALTNLKPLAGLPQLTNLTMGGCGAVTNLKPLAGLTQLTSLDMSGCWAVTNLKPLAGLTQLTTLIIGGELAMTDLKPLAGLTQLTSLNMSGCGAVTNIKPLAGLTQLTNLEMSACGAVTNLKPLAGLTQLTRLDLGQCSSLTNLKPLAGLAQLTSLDMKSCTSLTDLGPLLGLMKLESLSCRECPRLRSTDALREIASLSDIDSDFHPAVVAELLAHAAASRKDRGYVACHARDWIREASRFRDGSLAEQERFATTLGTALNLLGEDPVFYCDPEAANRSIEHRYERYLRENPGFSADPWKAWLQGARIEVGFELMQRRVERQDIATSPVGCVGGICAVLPDHTAPLEEQEWGRNWLSRMETAWISRARELLPVSAAVCLAYARLGLEEELSRWLARFTDPSDPAALDAVHAAFAVWHLGREEFEAASQHAVAIQRSEIRDGLMARVIECCQSSNPESAGRLLLLVEKPELAGALAAKLAGEPAFVASDVNVERLLVACGGSAESLGDLIGRMSPDSAPSHLEALSERLRANTKSVQAVQQAGLLRLLAEALRDEPWQFGRFLSEDQRSRLVTYLSQTTSS